MSTLTSGIHVALRALLANQRAIEVVEHNVANANTPGFHRQSVTLQTSRAFPFPGITGLSSDAGLIGGGVEVGQIERFKHKMLDTAFRSGTAESAYWQSRGAALARVETALMESGDYGLLGNMDDFWGGWQALGDDPTNLGLRQDLIQRSQALVSGFNRRAVDLHQVRVDLDLQVQGLVAQVNRDSERLAHINTEIVRVTASGNQPNDLLDERDRLLEGLAQAAGVVAHEQADGQVLVSLRGHMLVSGGNNNVIELTPNAGDFSFKQPVWADGKPVQLPKSELAALLSARDEQVVEQQTQLDDLASTLADRVNTYHRAGYGLDGSTNLDFFSGSDALSLRLHAAIDDPAVVAAALTPGAPGDAQNALRLAGVRLEKLSGGGTFTLNESYSGQITQLGFSLQEAGNRTADRQLVLESLQQQRQAISGVSLDEEAANLVRYQRAYQAAARLMTVMDDMLNVVINGMGRVGL